MKASLALLAILALHLHTAHGCAHTYTHDGGLVPPQGRRLMEASDNASAAAPACGYTHVLAGRDWPESDDSCSWTCAGESQSPINVPLGADAVLSRSLRADLGFGTATNVRVLNLGHSVQVEFDTPTDGTASVAVAGDSVFGLYNATNPNTASTRRFNVQPLQFHFHSTSEHLVGGRSALLEFHLVTKLVATEGAGDLPVECPEGSDKMCLAVFGVLYDFEATDGDNVTGDPTIQQIIDNLPTCEEAGKECVKEVPGWELDLGSFFPNSRYQTYSGSLTTPPCSEGVIWHVFPTVKGSLSEKQLLDLQTALSASTLEGEPTQNRANNRVTQPRNDRLVFASGGVSRRMF